MNYKYAHKENLLYYFKKYIKKFILDAKKLNFKLNLTNIQLKYH